MQPAFLALGDSYTIGEGVAVADRWPEQLAARLRSEGIAIGGPRVVAQTGWTTDELATAMEASVFTPPYALVSLQAGVNNQYRGLPLDGYRTQLRALLDRAVLLAGGNATRVLAVSFPDWGVTPFAAEGGCDAVRVAREVDAFNAAARAEAADVGAYWVDVTGISRMASMRNELVGDSLHPSGAQYARWVDAALPAARRILRSA